MVLSYNLSVDLAEMIRRMVLLALALVSPVFLGTLDARRSQDAPGDKEHCILEIQRQIENGNLPEANRLLADAATRFPSDPGFDNLRGVIAAQQGDFATAEKDFRDAVKRAPKLTAAYLNLGRLYQEHAASDSQARDKALATYERVLAYDPSNAEAHYQSAVLLLGQGKYERSLEQLSGLPSETQASAQGLSIRCADQAALGHEQRAAEAAARLRASADFSELDAQQALPGLVAGKRNDLIISLFEELQTRHSLSPLSLQALALAYERVNNFTASRAALEKYVNGGYLSVASLLELARVAHEQQDYQGSLGYLAHARDLEPANASLHYDFGLVCLDLNLVAEARNSFEKAVTLDPENPSYNYAMGAASAFRQDPAEAVPYFEKYRKLRPDDPRGALALGAVYFRAKDYAAAAPWLAQAVDKSETAAQAHYYLGSIALQQSRLDDAQGELALALKAQPENPDTLAQLGDYYLLRRDYGRAETPIRHALRIDPDHYSANFYLLTLYTRTGDARREAQAKRFEALKTALAERAQELLRIVEVRPFETP
jgi:tetratricopeptide (TPR) repeat protein